MVGFKRALKIIIQMKSEEGAELNTTTLKNTSIN